jgi:pimeloyl-ACP methyl ester carboxylesterase
MLAAMTHRPVFLLPGLLEDASAFQQVIDGLSDVAACTVADLTNADTIAELAQGALRQAPAGTFTLVGHSMGGYVALEMLRQAPQRIARLVLLNTHARPDTPEATQNRERLMALADKQFDGVLAALMPKLMTAEHQKDPVRTGILGAMALAVGVEGFKRQQRAIIGRIDSRPHLGAIRCPTLVIAARDDALMPVELLRELADGIPGSQLAIVEDSGHMASMEQPAEVARLLREFIGGDSELPPAVDAAPGLA